MKSDFHMLTFGHIAIAFIDQKVLKLQAKYVLECIVSKVWDHLCIYYHGMNAIKDFYITPPHISVYCSFPFLDGFVNEIAISYLSDCNTQCDVLVTLSLLLFFENRIFHTPGDKLNHFL